MMVTTGAVPTLARSIRFWYPDYEVHEQNIHHPDHCNRDDRRDH